MSRALMTLIKEHFEGVEDVRGPMLPDIFDATNLRHLMLGKKGVHKMDPQIQAFIEEHPVLILPPERYERDSNIYTYGIKKYITNLKNAIVMQFEKLLKQYLCILEKKGNLSNAERVFCLYQIMGWENIPKDCLVFPLRLQVIEIIENQREMLDLQPGQKITNLWCKKNVEILLRHRVFLNRFFDKPFNLIPLCKLRHNFITVDNDVLLGILKELKIDFQDIDTEWTKYFDTKQYSKKEFSNIIETDGVSICIHYKELKVKALSEEEKKEKNLQIKENFKNPKIRKLGCDQGRKNIYAVVEEVEGKVKSYFLTREQYYAESGTFTARKQTEEWSTGIQDSLIELSCASPKGFSLAHHMAYLEVFLGTFDKLWEEYTKKRWANQRLRLYGGKKRSLQNFWNRVLGNENEREEAVLSYGNAKFASGGKGEMSVPNSKALNVAFEQKQLKVLMTDEWRSTKICYKTDQLLQLVKIQGNNKPLRGLLWCSSTIEENSKQGAFVDRDVNAAMNILLGHCVAMHGSIAAKRCAKEDQRPEILDRSKQTTRLPKQKVGKVLKKNHKKARTT